MEVSIDDDRNNTIIVHDTGSCNQDRNGIENKIIMTSSKNNEVSGNIQKNAFPKSSTFKSLGFSTSPGMDCRV